jgi:hypothetical protein
MMIPPSGASPYAAAAALDRQFRQDDATSPDDATSTPLESGPDVVVTLGQRAAAPSTYDASGRMAAAPAANASDDASGDAGDDTDTASADAGDTIAA